MSKIDRLEPELLSANPRASLSSWLRYADTVQRAFERKPHAYDFEPLNMKPSTVASRIRDAIRGCLAFGYPCDFASHAELSLWWHEVVVKHTDKKVYIGPQEEVTEALKTRVAGPKTTYTFDNLSFEEVAAFAVLLSSGRIVGPVVITHPPDISLIPERTNLEMMPRPDGSLVLL